MATHKFAGYLMMLKGNLKRNIGKLVDNHYCVMSGEKDLIISKIQLQYGLSVNDAKIASTWNVPIQ